MNVNELRENLDTFFHEYEDLKRARDVIDSLFINWDESLKDSYYKKSYNQSPLVLINMGLCCGVCGYSRINEKGEIVCINPIHRNKFSDVVVKPFQICELVTIGKDFRKYRFDDTQFVRRNPGKDERKQSERFNHVGFVFRQEYRELLMENKELNRFMDFINKELPDVYRNLKKEYKERREMEND